ncbi:MAG TPA: iron-sulfur cluster repair di-iron protein [Candidatus Dormibacteraeota bacterium]|nr:iron-sulfur cluster repair di-iron protein [Candidatus Dormibacteraeota bacterium]
MDTSARVADESFKHCHGARVVRDLVLEQPDAARIFETFGIDYCCGGGQTLAEACQSAKCSIEEVIRAISKCDMPAPERDWRTAPLGDLAQYIVERHHSFARAEISRLAGLISKLVSAHGSNHPELLRVQRIFEGLSGELLQHMDKEEGLLFPYIEELEEAARFSRRPPEPVFGTVQNPVAAMIMEHEASGQALDTMRGATSNYALPASACVSFKALYQSLPAFAADLHQHIHLENNILFPRAVELENDLAQKWR